MGDRTWTSIRFSGELTTELADALVEELDAQGCRWDDNRGHNMAPTRASLTEADYFYDEEANYGTMEEVTGWCEENHISYLLYWEAGGGYGPGYSLYNAVTGVTFGCGAIEGEPAVTLSDLNKVGSVEDLSGYLKTFNDFEANYGPLVIRDDK
jgi:hypothetical protein